MRHTIGALSGLLLALTSLPAHAQGDDQSDTRQSSAPKPGSVSDLISGLYGGNGITLDPGIVFHEAHFAAESQEQLTNLSNIISSSIGTVAFNSTVSAISFDIEEGVPVRSQESLGPLIAERATTIGKGKINLGVSYTHIKYRQLGGTKLSDLSITLLHDQGFGASFERDVIRLDLDLELSQEIVAFIGTYGITDSVDVGFVVPLNSIDGSVRSAATIIDNGGAGIHRFGGSTSAVSTNSASATGIGDVIIRAKWHAFDSSTSVIDGALITQATLETGDEDDLLGSGSNAFFVGAVASANLGKINPHINVGYEYFTDQPSSGAIEIDRSNLRAVAGFDIKARDNFSVAAELLGRWRKDGLDLFDVALGTKWAPLGNVPISANIVVPLNRNRGLRPDFYFTLGIESTF